ncbi:hypothetical protein HK098_007858 [Nowakowskiella sp. JEL0407]|nr:hypothetical protein HK098_007858 [Nowakowskiella sp. JEL0407]
MPERVWDYPRPPALEKTSRHLRVIFNGVVLADTTNGYRILETTHPPTYYFPVEDVKMEYLTENSRETFCEYKGIASYYDVVVGNRTIPSRAWAFKHPKGSGDMYKPIAGFIGFYASPFECFVDNERVEPQPGGFYGGWITS